MKNFTLAEKTAGEFAVRRFSEKAAKFYSETDPLHVYEYETADGKRYAYTGIFGDVDGLTFEELEKTFEEIQQDFED